MAERKSKATPASETAEQRRARIAAPFGDPPADVQRAIANERRQFDAARTPVLRNYHERRILALEALQREDQARARTATPSAGPASPAPAAPPSPLRGQVIAPAGSSSFDARRKGLIAEQQSLIEANRVLTADLEKGIVTRTRPILDTNTRRLGEISKELAAVDRDQAASHAAARAENPTERAVHLGLRMGGAAVGLAAGHKLAQAVAAGVEKQVAARSAELIELGTRAEGLLKAGATTYRESKTLRTQMAAVAKEAHKFDVMRRPTGGVATMALTALALGEAGLSAYIGATSDDEGMREAGYTLASAGAAAATAIVAEHLWRRGQTAMPVAEASRITAAQKTARQMGWRGGVPWKEGPPSIAAPDVRPRFATEAPIPVDRGPAAAGSAGKGGSRVAAKATAAATAAGGSAGATAAESVVAAATVADDAAVASGRLAALEARLGRVVASANPVLAATAAGVIAAQHVEGSPGKKIAVAGAAGAAVGSAVKGLEVGMDKLAKASPTATKIVGRALPVLGWGVIAAGAGRNMWKSYNAGGSSGDVFESAFKGAIGGPVVTRDADNATAARFNTAMLRWQTMRDAAAEPRGDARRKGWSNAARIASYRARVPGGGNLPYDGNPGGVQ